MYLYSIYIIYPLHLSSAGFHHLCSVQTCAGPRLSRRESIGTPNIHAEKRLGVGLTNFYSELT